MIKVIIYHPFCPVKEVRMCIYFDWKNSWSFLSQQSSPLHSYFLSTKHVLHSEKLGGWSLSKLRGTVMIIYSYFIVFYFYFFPNDFLNESERNWHNTSCQIESLSAMLHIGPDNTLLMWSDYNKKSQSNIHNNFSAVVK